MPAYILCTGNTSTSVPKTCDRSAKIFSDDKPPQKNLPHEKCLLMCTGNTCTSAPTKTCHRDRPVARTPRSLATVTHSSTRKSEKKSTKSEHLLSFCVLLPLCSVHASASWRMNCRGKKAFTLSRLTCCFSYPCFINSAPLLTRIHCHFGPSSFLVGLALVEEFLNKLQQVGERVRGVLAPGVVSAPRLPRKSFGLNAVQDASDFARRFQLIV